MTKASKSSNAANARKRMVKIPRPLNAIQSVKRTLVIGIPKIAADTGAFRNVRLADFVGSADFTSLFTQYRIRQVQYVYTLVNAPNNNASFPTLYVSPQTFQYTGAPTSRDDVLQFQGVRPFQFGPTNITYTISVVPGTFIDASGLVSGGMVKTSPWLSTANNGNQHFTIVDWISRYNSTSDPTHTLELQITAWFDLKSTR
jgi:hypothetical protein